MNVSFRDYIRVIFRQKTIIIATVIIILICVFTGLQLKTPVYYAYVKMLITAEKQITAPYYRDLGGYNNESQISFTQSEIVISTPVLERAVRSLNLHERPVDYEKHFCTTFKLYFMSLKEVFLQKVFVPLKELTDLRKQPIQEKIRNEYEEAYRIRTAIDGLRGSISVEPIKDTDLFLISVADFDPEAAAAIANVVSRSYVIFDLEQQLAELELKYGEKHQVVMQLKDSIDKMTKNLTGVSLPSLEAIGPASTKIIEQAQVPFFPVQTSKRFAMILAFFMSLFFGVILAYGFEYIDPTLKSPQDIEMFLNLPYLGFIPKNGYKKHLITDKKHAVSHIQSYQQLSDHLYLSLRDKNLKSVLITADSHCNGLATIVANLGIYLSDRVGYKVLVIDANLRAPELHTTFHIPGSPGFADVLEGKISLEKATQYVNPNLAVLPTRKILQNPISLLNSSEMIDLIKRAKEKYEIILVDYANLKNIKEVCILSSYLDGIALIVNEGKTRRHVVKALLSPLERKKANLIGVILNDRTFAIPEMIYKRL